MMVVAGATGKTGSSVAARLLQAGEQVRVLVRDAAAASRWRERGAEARVVALEEPLALAAALEGADALYALVPEDLTVSNLRALRLRIVAALAAAVRSSRVPHVVLLSAAAATCERNGLAAELGLAERELRGTGARLTALRASYFQENVLAALGPAAHAGMYPNFLPRADLGLPMVATVDVASIAARSMLEPPARSEVIDLLGPRYAAEEVAEELGRLLGESVRVVDVPAAEQRTALLQAGLPAEFATALAELYRAFAAGIELRGDRCIEGATTLRETLAAARIGRGERGPTTVAAAGGTPS